jgi:hypothetical protein
VVLNDENYKMNCEKYNDHYEICKLCQMRYLVKNTITKWPSGNEIVDDFIHEMQLKINIHTNVVFEWIPYNQFHNVKEMKNDNLYLAIWNDGPLKFDYHGKRKWIRAPDKNVALKFHPYNSQNITKEFLIEV